MAKVKAALLDCGHFSVNGRCDICADRKVAQAARAAAERVEIRESDPRSPACVSAPAAIAVLGADEPLAGVYDIPDSIYHRDPLRAYGTESLSGSTARFLVPPSTPAHYRWRMDHPNEPTAAMILGSAVHALTLETAELAIFEGSSWTTKAGTEFLIEHDPDGDEAPILAKDLAAAKAMAYALLHHPIVAKALTNGKAEQAIFAQDDETGVWLRGKLDYLQQAVGGRLIVTDVKTAQSAHFGEFSRSAAKLSYHVSDAHYGRIVKLLGLAKRVTMIYATVESHPPYLVSVHQISDEDLRRGDELDQLAIRTFARCMETGNWPGYPLTINKLTLPVYAARSEEESLLSAEEGDPS